MPPRVPGVDEVTYSRYLRLNELLAQQEHAGSNDELLFVVVHQSHELWFKQSLAEVTGARDDIDADAFPAAIAHLRRLAEIFRLLVAHWSVLSTLTPSGYLEFRHRLGTGSGFQSVQFRELEFLCGLRDPQLLDRMSLTDDERTRLLGRLSERSLAAAFEDTLERHGVTALHEVLLGSAYPELHLLCEALMDMDESLAVWRGRHVVLVERQIGHKPGTGGSDGVGYLRSTTTKRLFPALWAARSDL